MIDSRVLQRYNGTIKQMQATKALRSSMRIRGFAASFLFAHLEVCMMNVPQIFASDVFNCQVMQERLPKEI